MVIARIEALISGAGGAEAIRCAEAYIAAGADAIMIHSGQKTFDESHSFIVTYNKLDKRVPVVAVPSMYNYVTEDDLFASGITLTPAALACALTPTTCCARRTLEYNKSMRAFCVLVPVLTFKT